MSRAAAAGGKEPAGVVLQLLRMYGREMCLIAGRIPASGKPAAGVFSFRPFPRVPCQMVMAPFFKCVFSEIPSSQPFEFESAFNKRGSDAGVLTHIIRLFTSYVSISR